MSLRQALDRRNASSKEEHWIPLSDLMTGLMMLFMLVAIIFMLKVQADSRELERMMVQAEQQAQQMRDIAVVYQDLRRQLYERLRDEFAGDLHKWGAELDRDLALRFEEPEVLFDVGQAAVKPRFKQILDDFFPRYVSILSSPEFRDSIEEIRIEGHTSSVWTRQTTADVAYIRNMELSQSRTRSTLEYVLGLPEVAPERNWLMSRLTANGLSSSRLRLASDGTENSLASQRVEFRVRTNSDARMQAILRASQ